MSTEKSISYLINPQPHHMWWLNQNIRCIKRGGCILMSISITLSYYWLQETILT